MKNGKALWLLIGVLILCTPTTSNTTACTIAPLGYMSLRRVPVTAPAGKRMRSGVSRASLVEEFSFSIADFKMIHQSETNNLLIAVRYRYVSGILASAYPDVNLIVKDVEEFLQTYPNKSDYWEVVNKKLTELILEKYPPISRITVEIQVSPSRIEPYPRASSVVRDRYSLARQRNRSAASKVP
jgi:hypothetical protein